MMSRDHVQLSVNIVFSIFFTDSSLVSIKKAEKPNQKPAVENRISA